MIPSYYWWNITKLHRCKYSAEQGGKGIYFKTDIYVPTINEWVRGGHEGDREWMSWHSRGIANIKYCPWCGEELK